MLFRRLGSQNAAHASMRLRHTLEMNARLTSSSETIEHGSNSVTAIVYVRETKEIHHASFCSSIEGKGFKLHVRIFTIVADGAYASFCTG